MNVTGTTGRHLSNRGILGIDIGSTAVHVALVVQDEEQSTSSPTGRRFETPIHGSRSTRGRPLLTLARMLEEDIFSGSNPSVDEIMEKCGHKVHCAVTGFSGDLFTNRIPAERINEVLAVSTAVRRFHPKARSILDLGGQFTKFIKLGRTEEEGLVVDCALNGLCAAGSGTFLEQQAARLKMPIRELAQAAMLAERGATIAGRCSVFAKSDMIHLQQKGAPVEEIAYGLCLALVRTFTSTVLGHRTVDSPVAFAGGGSANPGLLRAFRRVLELEESGMIVDPLHSVFGAIGAAMLGQSGPPVPLDTLVRNLTSSSSAVSISSPQKKPTPLSSSAMLSQHSTYLNDLSVSDSKMQTMATGETRSDRTVSEDVGEHEPLDIRFVKKNRDDVVAEDPGIGVLDHGNEISAFLGIDVGSVSTNVVVLSPDDEVYLGIYLPTRGRPVEVLAETMRILRDRFEDRLRVIASGATGSGRHLAGRVLGLDVVHNEITAQMVSASAYVPDVDTIFEIGGQDSKYIGARGGNLDAFEMNKICSAGTGSFLEEQAEQLGVKIIGEFSQRAFRSKRPHDLGSHCTVFMETEIVRAMQSGAEVDDLCAGLAYSIAKNYLDRVVAGRPIGEHIVFSGGTGSNEAVVAAFGRILGRSINVHPANRIAGAIGAGLLAKRFYKSHIMRFPEYKSSFRGLDAIENYTLKSFECSRCPNLCQVNQVIVGDRKAHFGDACERFASRDAYTEEKKTGTTGKTIPISATSEHDKATEREATDLFDLRTELLADHLPQSRPRMMDRPTVGLPMASLNLELGPLWAAFLDELGYTPVLSGSTTPSMMNSGSHGLPSEVCLPLKSAAGHAADLVSGGIERILLPNVLELPPRNEKDSPHTCLFAQSLSDMLRTLRPSEIWAPHVCLAHEEGINETVREFSTMLQRPPEEIRSALEKAIRIQNNFRDNREAIGRKVLADTEFDRAVVVMGKPYNCHDPYLNLDLSRHLRRLGLKAIPMDMIPLGDIELDSRFNVLPWAYNRDQIRALQRIEEDPRLYPLVVTNFGCGPDAFTLNHLNELMSHRPHLVLEFDEHRGEAGLVTRLEAFYDEIDQHIRRGRKNKKKRSIVLRRQPKKKGTCHVPLFCDHSHIFAAVFRGGGMDVKMLPPSDEVTVRKAETVGSGKECHPYRLVAGDLVKLVESGLYSAGDVFFIPGTVNPCLMPQYGDAARYLLRSLGESDLTVWDPPVHEMESMFGIKRIVSFYEGLLATDMLMIASCRFRPYERHPGTIDAVHEDNIRLVANTVEHCGDMAAVMGDCIRRLRQVPMTRRSRLPVVGIAGDIYTRINSIGNANLFRRLEEMGCEVWPHPYFAGYEDFCRYRETVRSWKRTELGSAFYLLLTSGGLQSLANAIGEQLGPDLAAHCVEPSPSRLSELAAPYVGPLANPLLHSNVGKIVDFINRGAAGVINAVGLNCMVGIASDAAVRAIKRDAPLVPVITLVYGGAEGPSQRIRLETFIHQVGGRLSPKPRDDETFAPGNRGSDFGFVRNTTP